VSDATGNGKHLCRAKIPEEFHLSSVVAFREGDIRKPRISRGFLYILYIAYLLRPEPGPVGASVDPLGEAPAPMVFPDGFLVVFGPVTDERAAPPVPVVLPVVPLIDEPVVEPLAAAPPAAEPAPDEPPLLCASANVLESARAVASAIVEIFMVASFLRCHE
jgi:hypothetical protein